MITIRRKECVGSVTFKSKTLEVQSFINQLRDKWVLDKYLKETGYCNEHVYHMSVQDIREVIGNIYKDKDLLNENTRIQSPS